VTGWAQIRYGYANNLKEETEKMRYDLHYIKQMSLGLDLRILFETLKVVITGGRGATLTEDPTTPLPPIYFGSDQARRARNPASKLRLHNPAPTPFPGMTRAEGDQRAIEGLNNSAPRAASRDVA
jgi:hypothetical protein